MRELDLLRSFADPTAILTLATLAVYGMGMLRLHGFYQRIGVPFQQVPFAPFKYVITFFDVAQGAAPVLTFFLFALLAKPQRTRLDSLLRNVPVAAIILQLYQAGMSLASEERFRGVALPATPKDLGLVAFTTAALAWLAWAAWNRKSLLHAHRRKERRFLFASTLLFGLIVGAYANGIAIGDDFLAGQEVGEAPPVVFGFHAESNPLNGTKLFIIHHGEGNYYVVRGPLVPASERGLFVIPESEVSFVFLQPPGAAMPSA